MLQEANFLMPTSQFETSTENWKFVTMNTLLSNCMTRSEARQPYHRHVSMVMNSSSPSCKIELGFFWDWEIGVNSGAAQFEVIFISFDHTVSNFDEFSVLFEVFQGIKWLSPANFWASFPDYFKKFFAIIFWMNEYLLGLYRSYKQKRQFLLSHFKNVTLTVTIWCCNELLIVAIIEKNFPFLVFCLNFSVPMMFLYRTYWNRVHLLLVMR